MVAERMEGDGADRSRAVAVVLHRLARRPSPDALVLGSAVLALGVVVPLVALTLGTPWPTLALPVLVAVGGWWVRRRSRRTEEALERAHARLHSVTVHDELTGCSNRAGLHLLGSQLLHDVRRRGDALHAFVIDVDRLSRVKSVLGQDAGDEVLVAVAEAVRTSTRGADVTSRGQGDEFVVVGPGCGMQPGELERRVRGHLALAPPVPGSVWPCRVTVGKGLLEPWDDGELDDLIQRAREDLQLRTAMRAPSAPEPPVGRPS